MKNYLVSAGIAALVVLVGFLIVSPVSRAELASAVATAVNNAMSRLGSNTSSPQDSPYTTIGGVQEFQETIPFVSTSSFVGSIKNPYGNASSSISIVSVNATGNPFPNTNFAINLYVSTSTTAYGTSTPALAVWSLGNKVQFSFDLVRNTATTTTTATGGGATGNPDILPGVTWTAGGGVLGGIMKSNYILGPNEFLNFNIATTSAGVFASYLTGSGITVKIRKL